MPPLYPFLILLALVVVAFGLYRWRNASIESRSRQLALEVADRTLEIAEQTADLEALYQADQELERHVELDRVLQALVDIAINRLHADKSAVLAWDDHRERLIMRVARNFSAAACAHICFSPGSGAVGRVMTTGEAALVEDAPADLARLDEPPEVLAALLDEGVRSCMHLPIRLDREIFGVFSVCYTTTRAFGDREQRLFTALAQRAALAVQKARLYEEAQLAAALEERSRLARDLHDAVTQTLFSASLIAEVLPEIWGRDPTEGRQLLGELRQLTRGALAEMRALLLELRPAALVEADLGDLLRQLAESTSGRSSIPVIVTLAGCPGPKLPEEVHVALYRIAQESLNNVVKKEKFNDRPDSRACR